MNRLQKKCFIASTGTHLLLAVILVVGPAFLSSSSKSNDMPTLDVIPSKLIDGNFSGGGSSKAKPPPATPAPPTPPAKEPAPPVTHEEKTREPDPPKVPVKRDTAENDSLVPAHEPRKHKDIDLTPVTHHTIKNVSAKKSSETDDRAREAREAADEHRRAVAAAIGRTARSLSDDVSPTTSIEADPGTGGGEAYANYGQVVKSIYEHAWVPPDDASSDNPITRVSVTIASDGRVVESHITRPSGDSPVDNSVRRTLDRVTFIAPFPDGAKEKQRTYIIKFDLRAKRLLG